MTTYELIVGGIGVAVATMARVALVVLTLRIMGVNI